MKHAENVRKGKWGETTIRATRVECTLLLLGKEKISEISNAKWDLSIEELRLRCIVVERKELITKMKSMLVANAHPNAKDENAKKRSILSF